MEELIKQMRVEQLVELINECADDYGVRFPYIMENDDDNVWEDITNYWDAHVVATAVSNGRYCNTDKWLIVVDDAPEIFSFSDAETLFQFISPAQIADLCQQNGIELSVNFKRL